jgi:hypothetical protein
VGPLCHPPRSFLGPGRQRYAIRKRVTPSPYHRSWSPRELHTSILRTTSTHSTHSTLYIPLTPSPLKPNTRPAPPSHNLHKQTLLILLLSYTLHPNLESQLSRATSHTPPPPRNPSSPATPPRLQGPTHPTPISSNTSTRVTHNGAYSLAFSRVA